MGPWPTMFGVPEDLPQAGGRLLPAEVRSAGPLDVERLRTVLFLHLEEPLGGEVERRVPRGAFELVVQGLPDHRVLEAQGIVDVLELARPLTAERAVVVRVLRVPLDVDDLVVLHVDEHPARGLALVVAVRHDDPVVLANRLTRVPQRH